MKLKALLTVLLCLAVAAPLAATVGMFSDVDGHDNAEAIDYLRKKGIARGYPDGRFWPNRLLSREGWLAMADRLWTQELAGLTRGQAAEKLVLLLPPTTTTTTTTVRRSDPAAGWKPLTTLPPTTLPPAPTTTTTLPPTAGQPRVSSSDPWKSWKNNPWNPDLFEVDARFFTNQERLLVGVEMTVKGLGEPLLWQCNRVGHTCSYWVEGKFEGREMARWMGDGHAVFWGEVSCAEYSDNPNQHGPLRDGEALVGFGRTNGDGGILKAHWVWQTTMPVPAWCVAAAG